MDIVEMLEHQVEKLGAAEFRQFNTWFAQYRSEREADTWDKQIECDAKAGRLDALANLALEDYWAGKAIDL